MFGSEILEIGVGLAFTFFLVSSICNGIVEIIAELTKARAKHLEQGIKILLGGDEAKKLLNDLYAHHLVDSGFKDKVGGPTYISAENFAEALIDCLVPQEGEIDVDARIDALKNVVSTQIANKRVKDALLKAISKGEQKLENVQKEIADWFNNSMWDLSKWYKRWTKRIVIISSIVIIAGLNIDSIQIVQTLYTNDELRTSINAAAESYVKANPRPEDAAPAKSSATVKPVNTNVLPTNVADSTNSSTNIPANTPATPVDSAAMSDFSWDTVKARVQNLQAEIDQLKVLPIGWTDAVCMDYDAAKKSGGTFWWVFMKILGLGLTIGAVSLGSGFWYDFITKFLNFSKKTS